MLLARLYGNPCSYMADMIIQFLQGMLEDVTRHPLETADGEEANEELPTPMFKVCRQADAQMNLCVLAGVGWR